MTNGDSKPQDKNIDYFLKEAMKKIDMDQQDPDWLKVFAERLVDVAFGTDSNVSQKIEALKIIKDNLHIDIPLGKGIMDMEDYIIQSDQSLPWDRAQCEQDKKAIQMGTRVACLYKGQVFLVGRVSQGAGKEKKQLIIQDLMTNELVSWNREELRSLTLDECRQWIDKGSQERQGSGLSLPPSHVRNLLRRHNS